MPGKLGEDFVNRSVLRLIRLQHRGGVAGEVAHVVLRWHGTDVHPDVDMPEDTWLRHAAIGVVIHPRTTLGRRVWIYHGVTIARGRVWERMPEDFGGFVIEDGAVLGAGCTVVSDGPEPLVVARGSVVAAGAVLTRSTGPGEVWAGVPARHVSHRDAGASRAGSQTS